MQRVLRAVMPPFALVPGRGDWESAGVARSTSESKPAPADQVPVPAQDGGSCEQQTADG